MPPSRLVVRREVNLRLKDGRHVTVMPGTRDPQKTRVLTRLIAPEDLRRLRRSGAIDYDI